MILKIANDDRSIIKKGVYLFSLGDYPKIQDWEWNNILAFISYEKACGDKLEIYELLTFGYKVPILQI